MVNTNSRDTVYEGTLSGLKGDFSDFNPISKDEFMIRVGTDTSFHFGIGMWWLERTTYELAVDFMIQSRHYVGNTSVKRSKTYAWRDDHHFSWALHTLVSQFLSNPEAYLRMPNKVEYVAPFDATLWGDLEPFDESAPDIVKLMHWGVDVIVTQDLKHEHLKAQLAYFLYAWPYISKWLPVQNYAVVKDFVNQHWEKTDVDRSYPFDQSSEHNMLALRTQMGTTKGELPPGSSLQPNLLMFEVAKRDSDADSMKYMNAAVTQAEWMLENLNWEDSITTKGQRMSEHITMTGFAFFYNQFPEYVPSGMALDVQEWADVMIRRSDNMWDFRKLTDGVNWTPFGEAATQWNEPGNVLGFPACLISAMQILDDPTIEERLNELVYSHLDNAWGKNPVGRHFSYDGANEIEGVDLGWYSYYIGGVGLLEEVPFVFDGAPKNDHYPYHPEIGDIGWTEGWIQFNTAFNISLAYMAHMDTEIGLLKGSDSIELWLKAPLNFDYEREESVRINAYYPSLDSMANIILKEESKNSYYFKGKVPYPNVAEVRFSYGYGYMEHQVIYVNHDQITVPPVPDELTAKAVSKEIIELSWDDASDLETNYVLERKTDGSFTELIVLAANTISYSDIDLEPNTTYTYRLAAVNEIGKSDYSIEVIAKNIR